MLTQDVTNKLSLRNDRSHIAAARSFEVTFGELGGILIGNTSWRRRLTESHTFALYLRDDEMTRALEALSRSGGSSEC